MTQMHETEIRLSVTDAERASLNFGGAMARRLAQLEMQLKAAHARTLELEQYIEGTVPRLSELIEARRVRDEALGQLATRARELLAAELQVVALRHECGEVRTALRDCLSAIDDEREESGAGEFTGERYARWRKVDGQLVRKEGLDAPR